MRSIFAIFIIGILISTGCSTDASVTQSEDCLDSATCNAVLEPSQESDINVDKLEVYHFHGTNQCYSCKTVGDYAEETVNTYFKEELDSGKIVFGHINAELVENMELAQKYKVTGSSLWLGVYDNNGFHPEENANVWYKISDKEDYMNYLKGLIEKRLAGDYS